MSDKSEPGGIELCHSCGALIDDNWVDDHKAFHTNLMKNLTDLRIDLEALVSQVKR